MVTSGDRANSTLHFHNSSGDSATLVGGRERLSRAAAVRVRLPGRRRIRHPSGGHGRFDDSCGRQGGHDLLRTEGEASSLTAGNGSSDFLKAGASSLDTLIAVALAMTTALTSGRGNYDDCRAEPVSAILCTPAADVCHCSPAEGAIIPGAGHGNDWLQANGADLIFTVSGADPTR